MTMQWTVGVIVLLASSQCSAFIEMKDFLPSLEYVKNREGVGLKDKSFFVVDPGNNSANYTFNLTGLVLLGLGIAAALSFYVYFSTFTNIPLNRSQLRSRSVADLMVNLNEAINQTEEALERQGIPGSPSDCRLLIVCEAMRKEKPEPFSLGLAISLTFRELLKELNSPDVSPEDVTLSDYVVAAMRGDSREECRRHYYKCPMDDSKFEMLLSMSP